MFPFLQTGLQDFLVLARQVQADPGFIVGPIAAVFGFILDLLFNLVYAITPNNSLGFAIILLTVVAMVIMLPLGVKTQRSMTKMQQLGPEVEKIKAKYGDTTDAELKRKMNAEIQALYGKHKINPLGGCLPMIIQMPLFFALLFIMQQTFLYVGTLNDLYLNLADYIQQYPNYLEIMAPISRPFIPDAWYRNGYEIARHIGGFVNANGVQVGPMSYAAAVEAVGGNYINLTNANHMARVLSRFTTDDWYTVISQMPNAYAAPLRELYAYKTSIEHFFGLPLLENSGMRWPGVIIPFFTVLTTVGQSWLSQLVNKPKDERAKTQQTIMMVVMPLFMGFITITMPAGVGLYWIVSNLFRLVQQLVMNAQQGIKFRLPFSKAEA